MSSVRRCAGLLVTGLLMLALGGPATAETIEGQALVLAKDVAHGTVTLDGQIVLQIRESTQILSQDGRSIMLVQLPVARRVGGLIEVSPEATVRYQARVVGGANVAEKLRVVGGGPR